MKLRNKLVELIDVNSIVTIIPISIIRGSILFERGC